MNKRQEYIMEQADFDTLMDACKSVPLIMLQCGTPPSPQENANKAWINLGIKMGFDGTTVEPSDSNRLRFTAIPNNP